MFTFGWSMGWFGHDTPTYEHPDDINQVHHLVLIEPSTTDRSFQMVRVCDANTKAPEEARFCVDGKDGSSSSLYEGQVLVIVH